MADFSIRRHVDLAPYNTLGVGATAGWFVKIREIPDVARLLEAPPSRERPVHILGGGSNVLFLGDVDGIVAHVAVGGREVIARDDRHLWLKAGAGENWHALVRHCVEQGWGGIENLSLIPGTVGAAPIQNIGAYGAELSGVFHSLTAVNLSDGTTRTFDREACRFGYRDSYFKGEGRGQWLVADVTLRLSLQHEVNTGYDALRRRLEREGIVNPDIDQVSRAVMAERRSKLPDPDDLGNAGSFFKNPVINRPRFEELRERWPGMPHYPAGEGRVKVPAGWLIEETGWKGRRVGPVGTYRQQALVIVNHGGATGHEVWELARRIRDEVAGVFGIELVPEVNIIS
ncbi:MAG: UDP-N-acetylmuramate dehydrogenase [Balneolaceae bacterium]|nr:UDP-N-acetylmuramate dehydrogenase [Balneolaceae bacterium]